MRPTSALVVAFGVALAALAGGSALAIHENQGLLPNGLLFNGTWMNGIRTQGIVPNGTLPNGLLPRGAFLTGARIDGAALCDATPIAPLTLADRGRDGAPIVVDTVGALERYALEYAAGCAWGPEVAVEASCGERTYRFSGDLGLAPTFGTEACGESCERWISACMLARTNARGAHVRISLRGVGPASLASDVAERDAWSVEEGAFWGNVFGPSPEGHACRGADYDPEARTRICTTEDAACGFEVAGDCERVCAWSEGEAAYASCAGSSSAAAREVITVYVQDGASDAPLDEATRAAIALRASAAIEGVARVDAGAGGCSAGGSPAWAGFAIAAAALGARRRR